MTEPTKTRLITISQHCERFNCLTSSYLIETYTLYSSRYKQPKMIENHLYLSNQKQLFSKCSTFKSVYLKGEVYNFSNMKYF